MSKLTFSSANPLYQQLMDDIKLDISNAKYAPGDKIPTETELAEIYQVSRITVRRAVSELCDEGYLVKRQGKGTYVTPPKITRKIMQDKHVHSFTATCAMSGMQPGGRTVDIRIVPSRQEEQNFFKMPKDGNVVFVQRVRTADGDPVLLENTFFPSPEVDDLRNVDLTNRSLNDTLRKKYGRSPVDRQTTKVEVSRASKEYAALLNIAPGDPLFFITSYFLDERGQPIAIARHYFLSSRFIFYF